MATNRTRRSRNRRDNIVALTGPQRDSLLHGHDFFRDAWQTPDDRRKAWELHKADLMIFWLQDPDEWLAAGNQRNFGNPEPGGPGTRPCAWWDFDAKDEPRPFTIESLIALETEKRGDPDHSLDFAVFHDCEESAVVYLHRLKLLSKPETAYLKRLSKDPTDWDFLQRNGWLTAGGRRQWFLSWCRSLTPKVIASRRLDLQYLARLGLSPVVPRHDMGPESEHLELWQLADLVIIPD